MKSSERLQWMIFVFLLALLGLSFFYSPGPGPSIYPVAPGVRKLVPPASSDRVEGPYPSISTLRWKAPEFNRIKRNLFEFGADFSDGENEVLEPEPMLTSQQPAPQSLEVRYLGFYRERVDSQKRLAAITNGGQISIGGPGDILAGKYKVIEIDEEFLVLQVLQDGQILRLPLGRP